MLTFTFFDIEADDANACNFDFLQVGFRLFCSTQMNDATYANIIIYNLIYQRKPHLYIIKLKCSFILITFSYLAPTHRLWMFDSLRIKQIVNVEWAKKIGPWEFHDDCDDLP